MANGWAPFIGLVVVAIFCGAAWFLSPKGEEQTYVARARALLLVLALYGFYRGLQAIWRSTLILSASAMYIMWAITFLAQLHPLITPIRSDLRGPGDFGSEPPQRF